MFYTTSKPISLNTVGLQADEEHRLGQRGQGVHENNCGC